MEFCWRVVVRESFTEEVVFKVQLPGCREERKRSDGFLHRGNFKVGHLMHRRDKQIL